MEIRRTIDRLKTRGIDALIIDLRSNGGGIMTSAIDAVRLFLDRGTIVRVKTAAETVRYEAETDGFIPYKMPLVILTDENTASAAEIFSAALKDHQRATIIGRKTRGKDLVQTVYQLQRSDAAICLTTASRYPHR